MWNSGGDPAEEYYLSNNGASSSSKRPCLSASDYNEIVDKAMREAEIQLKAELGKGMDFLLKHRRSRFEYYMMDLKIANSEMYSVFFISYWLYMYYG